jgi:hypothetical protein
MKNLYAKICSIEQTRQRKANQSFPEIRTTEPDAFHPYSYPYFIIHNIPKASSSICACQTSWSRRNNQLRRLPNLYTSLRGRSSAALFRRPDAAGVGKPESTKSGSCRVAAKPPILSPASSTDGSLALIVRMRNLSRNLEVTLCRLAVEASPCGNVREVFRRWRSAAMRSWVLVALRICIRDGMLSRLGGLKSFATSTDGWRPVVSIPRGGGWAVLPSSAAAVASATSPSTVGGRKSIRHKGQVPETFSSHGSTHSGWNLWLQGRTRTSSPRLKSSVQIEQPSEPSS